MFYKRRNTGKLYLAYDGVGRRFVNRTQAKTNSNLRTAPPKNVPDTSWKFLR